MRHAHITIISTTALVITLAIVVLVMTQRSRTTKQPAANQGWIQLSSSTLGITLQYPASWVVDRSSERQGTLTLTSGALSLDAPDSVGRLTVNKRADNTERLTPQEWFDRVIAPNVDPPTRIGVGTTDTYPTYTVVVNELQVNRHIYVFSGTHVVEAVFPENQSAFNAAYTTILNSLRIK